MDTDKQNTISTVIGVPQLDCLMELNRTHFLHLHS